MRRVITLLVAFILVASVAVASAVEYKNTRILAATSNPNGSLHATALERFKKIVEEESGGKVRVLLFLGGSMGDEQANVKQLRSGELHVAALAAGNLTPFSPKASVLVLPYLFPEIADAYKLLGNDKFIDELADGVAEESSTRPLSWLVGGYRVLTNSKKPVVTMGDLKGLRIRVPAVPVQLESFRSWGVEPHPLAWSETFNALQQGVADGQENPHSINRDQKFWEVQKYISDLHYMLWVGPILVSERWYQSLDPTTKSLINKAAKQAAVYEWNWVAEQNKKSLQACIDHGMQFNTLEDEDEWMTRARQLWPSFYERIGGKSKIDEALTIMGQK
ncbi:MAG: TRAP transporter substrate-binding protein [Halodesulfovibrio sp.]|uniref:TRAP transporter substrate-binding protein n=1 Tax=Halodesulfovibrio sp. TaxID=1912772 RepID=UPI00359DC46D